MTVRRTSLAARAETPPAMLNMPTRTSIAKVRSMKNEYAHLLAAEEVSFPKRLLTMIR